MSAIEAVREQKLVVETTPLSRAMRAAIAHALESEVAAPFRTTITILSFHDDDGGMR
jgi:hypothetical protein